MWLYQPIPSIQEEDTPTGEIHNGFVELVGVGQSLNISTRIINIKQDTLGTGIFTVLGKLIISAKLLSVGDGEIIINGTLISSAGSDDEIHLRSFIVGEYKCIFTGFISSR